MLIEEFSYADPNDPLYRKIGIRLVEMLTGQPLLKKLYESYQALGLPHHVFFEEAIKLLEVDIRWHGNGRESIPSSGPLILVANHPYGVLDGLAICLLAIQSRGDFKILINSLLCRAPELQSFVLPVDFSGSAEATKNNLASRQAARTHLESGGTLIVFPAGGISTTPTIFSREAKDDDWAPLVGQLVRRTRAAVVPVFFAGQNSYLFQIASHLNYSLRIALIFHEVKRRIGSHLDAVIGDSLSYDELEPHLPPANLARKLQAETHVLAKEL